MRHVFLLHLLYCHLLTCLFVHCEFYQSKLTLSESLPNFVILQHVGVSHCLLQPLNPPLLLFDRREEYKAGFIWRNDNFHRVVTLLLRLTTSRWVFTGNLVYCHISEIGSRKAVHHFVVLFSPLAVKVELIADYDHPVFLETFCLCFEEAVSFVMRDWFILLEVSKSFQNLLGWSPWPFRVHSDHAALPPQCNVRRLTYHLIVVYAL